MAHALARRLHAAARDLLRTQGAKQSRAPRARRESESVSDAVAVFALLAQYGMNEATHLPKSEKPEEIQVDTDWIKPGSAKDREDLIKLLVEKGADVNKTWNGKTPLDMVKEQGNIELVRFLRQKYVARWYAEVLREHNARFRLKDN